MHSIILSIYTVGSMIGYYGCIVYMAIMFIALIYVMRKYLKD